MTDDLRRVAVLYARRNSIYKQMPGCDVWDEDRDARMASCGRCELMGSAERESTPPAFAEFLVRIARASEVRQRAAA